ncbi:MAG: thymidine phosphorylase [Clostridia bacterium]|nr:thymidine phosphorylase [Clostridia bacterium]
MDIKSIIGKKRENKEISKEEIEYFVKAYTEGEIPDYQAAALIMAICINGMTEQEILDLTVAMANSGNKVDLSEIDDIVVDKHSTGGVGDKVTIVLMPIIASLGIPVAKMSGRGLGFTGGTVDKLEAIPGYRTNVSVEEFVENVKNVGISLIGQTENIAPADKKIYALRDAINCTKSIPLIASSIMSKKIALGANKLVLDITVGNGAFMKTKQEAERLAKCMKLIGQKAGIETVCVLTNMEEPLGINVGNTLEIKEAIEALKNNMQEDLREVVYALGAQMIKLAGRGEDVNQNIAMMEETLQSGKAYQKFLELITNQDGDISFLHDTQKLGEAKYVIPVLSEKDGVVEQIDAELVGSISVYVGAGRVKKEDEIDMLAGIVLNKKRGQEVKTGEPLAYVHTNDESKVKGAVENLKQAFKITDKKVKKASTVLGIIK